MKSGIPWSLRGVDEETREAIYAAARRAGLSVSEWLNNTAGDDVRRPLDDDGDAASVTAALDRLTRRLRTMDEASRAGVPDLTRRLDEIEHELDNLPRAGSRGSVAAAKQLAAAIDRLARDIEDSDERARRIIEGQRANRAAADLGRMSNAIRELDRRVARMSERAQPPRPERRQQPEERTPPLDDIRRRLDSLLAERSRAPAPPPSSDRAASIDAALRGLESRIDEAKARMVAPRQSAPIGDSEAIARLEQRLGDISSRLAERSRDGGGSEPPGPTGDLASAVAEITAHQRNLDDQAEAFTARRDQSALSATMALLRNDIAALGEQISTLGRAGAMDQSTAFDIARRIDALAAERPLDHALLNSIRADLDGLRETVEDRASAADIRDIADRLNALAHATPDRGRLDALGQEVLALRRALESDDSPRAIQRLEMHLAELSRNVEGALAVRNPAPELDRAIARLEQRFDDFGSEIAARLAEQTMPAPRMEIERLEERLDALGRNIVSTLGERDEVAPDVVHRFEERLDEIAARVDSLLDRSPVAASIETMQTRLENLIAAVEGISSAQQEPAALDELKAEIAAIRHDIAGREAPDTAELERQVRDLAGRLETATRPESDVGGLADLEAQVARLAAQLEEAGPSGAALGHVEESLAALQGHLARNQHESIEAARAEAREAVRELAKNVTPAGVDSELIRALRQDLDTLRAAVASGAASDSAQAPMDATLDDVAAHLGELERATGTHGMAHAQPATGAPETKAAGDRRADFIAAARRAAQAAADSARNEVPAQGEVYDEPESEAEARPRKAGAFSRISQAIRNRNRPLLLAAAAIVLAIGAMKLYGNFAPQEEANNLIAAEPPAVAVETVAKPAVPSVRDLITAAGAASAEAGRNSAAMVAPATPDEATTFAAPQVVAKGFGAGATAPSPAGFGAETAPPLPAATATGGLAPDPGIGSDKLINAVETGDPAAAFEVATRYAAGDRVKKDLAKAALWYERAAEGGIAVAQYRLGSLYERGQGVARDLTKAANWYQRAADQGNVNAMHNLAVVMSEGVDGTPDSDKALRWFLAAADYGLPDSQYNLGVIYARGLGASQDLVASYKWFAIAAAQGDADAKARRDEVAQVLSPDDLTKARAETKAWRAKPPLAEANGVSVPDGGWDGKATTLAQVDREALVKKIQTLLADQGFDPGPADGVIGAKTREAVRAYQRQNGIAETGQIDRTLVTALAQSER